MTLDFVVGKSRPDEVGLAAPSARCGLTICAWASAIRRGKQVTVTHDNCCFRKLPWTAWTLWTLWTMAHVVHGCLSCHFTKIAPVFRSYCGQQPLRDYDPTQTAPSARYPGREAAEVLKAQNIPVTRWEYTGQFAQETRHIVVANYAAGFIRHGHYVVPT